MWIRFKSNRRSIFSLYIFLTLFLISIFAEFISNDKPLIMKIDDKIYYPIIATYTEKEFGGFFDTEADYKNYYLEDKHGGHFSAKGNKLVAELVSNEIKKFIK